MATRTDALLPQAETGKITCVQHLRCGRLSPGAGLFEQREDRGIVPRRSTIGLR